MVNKFINSRKKFKNIISIDIYLYYSKVGHQSLFNIQMKFTLNNFALVL